MNVTCTKNVRSKILKRNDLHSGHSTHFQVGGDNSKVEEGGGGVCALKPVCKTKPYFIFTLTFSFLETK